MLIKKLEQVALSGSSVWVLYLMIVLSLLSISVMIERAAFFYKHRGDANQLGDKLIELLHKGDRAGAELLLKGSGMIEAMVIRRCLPWMDGGPESLSEAIEAEMGRKRKELEAGMTFLGTLGNNAPFIGLFGTVLGVIQAFAQLGNAGGGQDKAAMGNVMAAIAEALIATGIGLVVAIPAVVAFNMAQKKIGEIEGNVTSIGKHLLALMKFDPKAKMKHLVEEPAQEPEEREEESMTRRDAATPAMEA
jgi:biopolymer transport protein ExbB/biopolymer transport protein TolQ